MKLQISGILFALAAALVLGACASKVPAKQISSRELSDVLSNYVRVVSNGQEFFCNKEQDGHFLRDVCYTRSQMKERLLGGVRGISVTAAVLATPSGWSGPTSSGYTSFTGSGR